MEKYFKEMQCCGLAHEVFTEPGPVLDEVEGRGNRILR